MTKVALAYSGGLDTIICTHYLRHVKGMKVYTFSANLGQPEYLEPLAEQAVEMGASAANLADLREKFVNEFILPSLKAGAVYEEGYHLFSALARPLILQELVEIARQEGCDAIAHGSRGIGNDKIRLTNCSRALAPDLEILAPLEELGLRSPEDDIAYAQRHGLPFESVRQTLWNVEQNLWGCNVQLRGALDTWDEPPRDTYIMTVPPSNAPNKPTTVELEFHQGRPVSLDGEELPLVKLIERLNSIAGRCAVGRFDIIEDRISGVKTRELYEAPAAAVLHAARRGLESITLEKDLISFKGRLSRAFAEQVYEGLWFSPLREGLDAFFSKISERVTGGVRVSLYRGSVAVTGRRSPYSLFVPNSQKETSARAASGRTDAMSR
ncbi:MAG: argininosuccinate synthase [Planctomycetes bacterium]|nr:argininosuccinate synthase [Planctomycetota bacterium]